MRSVSVGFTMGEREAMRLRIERLLLGLHGLALLRGWPHGDPAEADERIEAIRSLVLDPASSEPLEVAALDLDAAYEVWSQTYDTIPNALLTAEEPVVRRMLADVPAGTAADVACGTGRLAALLGELGHRVVGVDASVPMLERAGGRLDAGAAAGDLHRLPLRDGCVDLVVCGLALTHADDLARPIAELARVVRVGGTIVLSDVHPVAAATGAQAMFKTADGARAVTRNHVHWTSAYLRAFAAAGLEVERCEEPLVDEFLLGEINDPRVRRADEAAILGLPLLLVWRLRRSR